MTVATLNDRAVVKGTVTIPRFGAWTADLSVDNDEDFEDPLTLEIGDGLEMVCAVDRQEVIFGKMEIRIVGGAGGLKTILTPKHYTGPTIREVLTDIVQEAGETISSEAEASVLDVPLEHWTTTPIPAGRMITELVKHAAAGTVWRIRPDGAIWMGVDAFDDAELDDIIDESRDGADGSIELATDFPSLQPGVSIEEREVDYVEHVIKAEKIRTFVWLRDEDGVTQRDRIKEAHYSVARAALPVPIYEGVFPCQLVKQPTDFLVDANPIAPLDAILPPLSNVPLHVGIPGAIVRVKPGSTVLIGWENGDPARIYAALWAKGAGVSDLVFQADKVGIGKDEMIPLVDGVVLASGIDPLTGKTYGQLQSASLVVTARKT